eukprot:2621901-Pyramimonas_sp.AAC.1
MREELFGPAKPLLPTRVSCLLSHSHLALSTPGSPVRFVKRARAILAGGAVLPLSGERKTRVCQDSGSP